MIYVSMTRMRLKSLWYFPLCLFHTILIIRQVQDAPGFMDGKAMAASDLSMWTVTRWQSEKDLNDFYRTGCHAQTARSIDSWATESAHAHQAAQTQELPDWVEIATALMAIGHFHNLDSASIHHTQRYIPAPGWSFLTLSLRPSHLKSLTS